MRHGSGRTRLRRTATGEGTGVTTRLAPSIRTDPAAPSTAHAQPERGYLRPLLTVWLGWLAVMTGANLAAPLYEVYASRFGFSSLVLTLVFTTDAIAPAARRGEVTAAFICCIYVCVGVSVVATGLLALRLSLRAAVGIVTLVLAGLALLGAGY
jgi:hypothetical protein